MGLLKHTTMQSSPAAPVSARTVVVPGSKVKPVDAGNDSRVAPFDVAAAYEKRLQEYIRSVTSNL